MYDVSFSPEMTLMISSKIHYWNLIVLLLVSTVYFKLLVTLLIIKQYLYLSAFIFTKFVLYCER
jgi:hypothetical protein